MTQEQAEAKARAVLCLGCEAGEPLGRPDDDPYADLCHRRDGLWLRCEADRAPKMTERITQALLAAAQAAPNVDGGGAGVLDVLCGQRSNIGNCTLPLGHRGDHRFYDVVPLAAPSGEPEDRDHLIRRIDSAWCLALLNAKYPDFIDRSRIAQAVTEEYNRQRDGKAVAPPTPSGRADQGAEPRDWLEEQMRDPEVRREFMREYPAVLRATIVEECVAAIESVAEGFERSQRYCESGRNAEGGAHRAASDHSARIAQYQADGARAALAALRRKLQSGDAPATMAPETPKE